MTNWVFFFFGELVNNPYRGSWGGKTDIRSTSIHTLNFRCSINTFAEDFWRVETTLKVPLSISSHNFVDRNALLSRTIPPHLAGRSEFLDSVYSCSFSLPLIVVTVSQWAFPIRGLNGSEGSFVHLASTLWTVKPTIKFLFRELMSRRTVRWIETWREGLCSLTCYDDDQWSPSVAQRSTSDHLAIPNKDSIKDFESPTL